MQVFWTILSGVSVYVFGQFILKLVIEPWQNQRECVALIAHNLIYYADVYSSPGIGKEERNHEAHIETRKLAAQLTATIYRIPVYPFFARLGLFPSESEILDARNQLIGLSNCTKSGQPEHNFSREKRIRTLLRIKDEE